MKVKWSEIVSKEVDSKLVEVSENLTKVKETIKETNKKVDEAKDRENRVNNIVIYRIPEAASKEDQSKLDKTFCMDLFNKALIVDMKEEEIRACFDWGKKVILLVLF